MKQAHTTLQPGDSAEPVRMQQGQTSPGQPGQRGAQQRQAQQGQADQSVKQQQQGATTLIRDWAAF